MDRCAGYKVKVVTNGSRLDAVSADMFSKIHKLTISLNSIDGDTHRLIHGYKGPTRLPFIIENIERLLRLPRARQTLQINCAVGSYNVDELEGLIRLSSRWNVLFAIRPVKAVFSALKPHALTPGQVGQARKKLDTMSRETGLSPGAVASLNYAMFAFQSDEPHRSRTHLLPCYAGFYGAYLASNGDYRLCCHCPSVMGNIQERRFSSLWKDGQVQKALYAASLMHDSGVGACSECPSCTEVQLYSRTFHLFFSRLPFQMRLLRYWYGRCHRGCKPEGS
jgi:MoaA/NifB/PqqE/SkfB family radical SAM enzyme